MRLHYFLENLAMNILARGYMLGLFIVGAVICIYSPRKSVRMLKKEINGIDD
jgi:hypothetical protein